MPPRIFPASTYDFEVNLGYPALGYQLGLELYALFFLEVASTLPSMEPTVVEFGANLVRHAQVIHAEIGPDSTGSAQVCIIQRGLVLTLPDFFVRPHSFRFIAALPSPPPFSAAYALPREICRTRLTSVLQSPVAHTGTLAMFSHATYVRRERTIKAAMAAAAVLSDLRLTLLSTTDVLEMVRHVYLTRPS